MSVLPQVGVALAWLVPASLYAAGGGGEPALAFPPPLESYQDGHLKTLGEVLRHRIQVQPLNLWATVLFAGAVLHTFFTHKFRQLAHFLEERHLANGAAAGRPNGGGGWARVFHFLGEVEAVFGIWVIPLLLVMAAKLGYGAGVAYLDRTHFTEPVFVVVVMAMASTRPMLRLAEVSLRGVARLGGGGVVAWWLSILTLGPLLGSLITEPAAMTIAASLLGRQFYRRQPSPALAYASLGLLFVNVSVGGTLTHFAAPPVLMVSGPWNWDTPYMAMRFGVKAALAIVLSNAAVWFVFRKEFARLQGADPGGATAAAERPIPAWVTLGHVLFMAFAVANAHTPVLVIGSFLFFMAFFEVTLDHQTELQLRSPMLVGFFLAGLVMHGGLQQWWIAPVLQVLSEVPLFLGSMVLTAFNDNAAITFLATLVPGLGEGAKYAVVAGAVAGGGLTVIANAPNPAGQAILGRHFQGGIAPLGLLLGALGPTAIAALIFLVLR